jgi:hypothetical protein
MKNIGKITSLQELEVAFDYWKGYSMKLLSQSLFNLPNLMKLTIVCYY